MPSDRRRDSELARLLRQTGVAMTIPFLLLAAPVVGLLAGRWLDAKLGTAPWGKVIGVALGLMAGGRETYLLIRRLSRELKSDDQKRP